jgi:ATP-dependent DNA helicase RecG
MSSIRVDACLELSVSQRGRALAELAEDQWFERKSGRIQAKDLAHDLVAFANAEGGTIVVGLRDKDVDGFDANGKRLSELQQASIDFTEPPVRASYEVLDAMSTDSHERQVLVIRIGPGERVHRTTSGECYLRIGDESRRLNFTQERELLFDRGQAQYDGEPAKEARPEDLDDKLVAEYADAIGHPDASRIFGARSLLTPDRKLTNAAYLLFGRRPQDLFPQALVRVVRYSGRERGAGARLNIAADERLEGSIPSLIHSAQQRIELLMPVRRHLGEQGRFVDTPLVPRDAWLEGLVNAVVHRSYSLGGDHIRVEIFDNRIEIESPGRFPGLVDVENPLKIARFARNPRIARVCADLRITQELGEGIRRIFEEMRHAGLDDPLYRQTSGSVRLTLGSSPRLDPELAAALPRGSTDVLRLLDAADRQLGTGDIAGSLGVSRPTVLQRLNALRDVGLIDWHGTSPQDPRAYWTLPAES